MNSASDFSSSTSALQLGLLDEGVRGDDPLHLRRLQRRAQVAGAGREVEHRRHAAIGVERKEGDDRAGAGRQHHADGFAALASFLQGGAQREGGADDVVVGQLPVVGIVQDDLLAPIFLAGRQQGREYADFGMARVVGGAQRRHRNPPSGAPPALYYVFAVI